MSNIINAKKSAFPQIKTEYDYYVARFEDREVKLLYRIRQYSLVPPYKVDRYRKSKINMKHYGIPQSEGGVEVGYYVPYAVKQVSLNSKRWLIDRILQNNIKGHDMTLKDNIERKWEENTKKLTATQLMDKEAKFLDTLSNYFLGGVEGEYILTMDMTRTIQKKEIVTIAGMMNSDVEDNITEFSSQAKRNWAYERMSKKKEKI